MSDSARQTYTDYVHSHLNVISGTVCLENEIQIIIDVIVESLKNGGKCMLAGNGGSAADAQHFAAELVGRFRLNRSALAAIALTVDTSVITACANDFGYETVFVRQFQALAKEKDVIFLISTSGESPSIIELLRYANSLDYQTIGLTGSANSTLAKEAKFAIAVGDYPTNFVQEAHICIYQYICEQIELNFLDI